MTASQPSSYFDYLTDDLLIEILRRLPLRMVHGNRFVSKRWLNITSCRNFIKSFIEYNTCAPDYKPPVALFYQHINDQYPFHSKDIFSCAFTENPDFKLTGFSLVFLRTKSPLYCGQPNIWSNGLLLCSSYNSPRDRFYVCNPLTRCISTIPRPPSCIYHSHIGFISKSTDNVCSFRIVRASLHGKDGYVKLQTYNSELKSWTEPIFENFQDDIKFSRDIHGHHPQVTSAIECNGLLYFKNRRSFIFVYDPYNDMKNIRIIKLPNESLDREISSTIGACNGHIRYAHWNYFDFRVWKLEDYETEKWSLVLELPLNIREIDGTLTLSDGKLSSYEFHPYDENIVHLHFRYRIVSCNMLSKSLTTVCELASPQKLVMFPVTLPWWPVSLH